MFLSIKVEKLKLVHKKKEKRFVNLKHNVTY